MKRWIAFYFAIILVLPGCGSNGHSRLIPVDQRVQATEIKADFLNLPSPPLVATPTPLPSEKTRKKGKKRRDLPPPPPTLTLGQLKGKVVVMDFWATWCGPCRMEIPTLVKMHDAYHDKGLEILGLSVEANDGQPKDFFKQFISNNQINYPIGLASRETLGGYGINPIPATFFVDKSGKIALSFVGVHPEEDFTNAVEALLKE